MAGDRSKGKQAGAKAAGGGPGRAGAHRGDEFDLKKILAIQVSRERVERLRSLTRFDQPGLTREAEEYLAALKARLERDGVLVRFADDRAPRAQMGVAM